MSKEASISTVARYMDAISLFVAIAFCPRFNLTLVMLVSFTLRSERLPGVSVGFRLPSGGWWGTDTSLECVELDSTSTGNTRLT